MRHLLIAVALLAASVAAADAEVFAPGVATQFVDSCVRASLPSLGGRASVAHGYCTCALRRVERRSTLAEFRASTLAAQQSGTADPQTRADARVCAVQAIRAAHLTPADLHLATPVPRATGA